MFHITESFRHALVDNAREDSPESDALLSIPEKRDAYLSPSRFSTYFRQADLFNTEPVGDQLSGSLSTAPYVVQRTPGIGLRHLIFGYLSNIAQRQYARKETVITWGLRIEPQANSKSKKSNPVFL